MVNFESTIIELRQYFKFSSYDAAAIVEDILCTLEDTCFLPSAEFKLACFRYAQRLINSKINEAKYEM